jgi:predicted Zn-dependent protease
MWCCAFALTACSIVGETGRRRIAFFPDSYMTELGASAYDSETSGKYTVITSGKDYDMVQRIGQRIAQASGKDYAWEFRLLDAPDVVNAFCLPGGKVAVYTGILKVTQNEDALAAVMGHEVAHATAEHGNERMSQGMVSELVLAAAGGALAQWTEMDNATQQGVMQALGMGVQVGALLPFSRKHESEADEIGLRYLVRAGYDPDEAPKLWERMAQLGGGSGTPEFMSTHPDPMRRAEELRNLIPKIVAEEGGKRVQLPRKS